MDMTMVRVLVDATRIAAVLEKKVEHTQRVLSAQRLLSPMGHAAISAAQREVNQWTSLNIGANVQVTGLRLALTQEEIAEAEKILAS